jgi:hypothetical protein
MNEETQTLTPAEEYITAPGLSYSSLSRLVDGPQAYLNKTKPTGDFLTTGSAVDVLLTEGEKAFHKQFYVMTATKPSSDMMIAYTECMIATDDRNKAFAASGYKKAVSDTKWEDEGKPFYDAIKAAGNKMVLDFEQYTAVQAVVNQLKDNKYTKQYFSKPPEGIEISYQFIRYFEYAGTAGKIKVDILVIDHNKKTIRAIDLKTTSKPPRAFIGSYRSYKYYVQGAWFKLGVEEWATQAYPEYTVEDFMFIVAEMGAYHQPLLFTMGEDEHSAAIHGGNSSMGYKIKGINDLLIDLQFYTDSGMWEYPREITENSGKIELDLFKT